MHIDSFLDVINACRFCFMCRHIDTTANVTFREADIPRGRALILDRIRMNPGQLANTDYIRTMYDCALSGACRTHCVSDYDEAGLVLAARRDIVDAGLAPTDVTALADSIADAFALAVEGDGGDLLYVRTDSVGDEVVDAFAAIMQAAGIAYRTLRVNDTGKALAVLGFAEKAKAMGDQFREAISATGCATVVTSCPAAFDALKNDLALDGIDVQHTSTYLLSLVRAGTLKPSSTPREATFLDSDFLRNYNGIVDEPRELLAACGVALQPFGTNPEESYACGEGAVVFDRLRPGLTGQLRDRVVSLMNAPDDLLVAGSPYTRTVLAEAGVRVLSIEEVVAER